MDIKKKLPVGVSDFKKMIAGNYYYVDQSLFIKEVIDKGDTILLIPRPRRFGKTLNLSMLKYFFDCCPNPDNNSDEEGTTGNSYKKLFDNLAISKAGEKYLEKMGKHPVIFLSFRNVKELDWESCLSQMKQLIADEYLEHDYLLASPKLKAPEKDYFTRIMKLKGTKVDYQNSLGKLLIFLNRYYGQRPVILIDEYDAPVYMGFSHGYYDEIINFLRNFLSGGLKDTDQYLEKGIVTGIMRIAKESIFSGLNNPGVYTLVSTEFSDFFGFTEKNMEKLLEDFDLLDRFNNVQEWYNGYRFGRQIIYNPWSIINFLASDEKKLTTYWINTADNEIVQSLLSSGGKELKEELELLISGQTIEKHIDDNIVLKNIRIQDNLLWSFLLMGGYLTYTAKRQDTVTGRFHYTLIIPNKEVKIIYFAIIENYFYSKIENKNLQVMLKALIEGDIALFENMLQKIVLAIFSYHDFGGEPEKVYHALVMGLLVWLIDSHEIKSNRESGYGRYDIMVIPKIPSGLGYVIEFKAVTDFRGETVPAAADGALKQIEEKHYEIELIERGIKNIKKLAIVFSGKDVYVKESPGN